MSSWARPGLKCVCIGDRWDRLLLDAFDVHRVPMMNEVLTVVAVTSENGKVGLQFDEIPTPPSNPRLAWLVSMFKPLITRTQEDDVALFRDLLTDAPVEVDA